MADFYPMVLDGPETSEQDPSVPWTELGLSGERMVRKLLPFIPDGRASIMYMVIMATYEGIMRIPGIGTCHKKTARRERSFVRSACRSWRLLTFFFHCDVDI